MSCGSSKFDRAYLSIHETRECRHVTLWLGRDFVVLEMVPSSGGAPAVSVDSTLTCAALVGVCTARLIHTQRTREEDRCDPYCLSRVLPCQELHAANQRIQFFFILFLFYSPMQTLSPRRKDGSRATTRRRCASSTAEDATKKQDDVSESVDLDVEARDTDLLEEEGEDSEEGDDSEEFEELPEEFEEIRGAFLDRPGQMLDVDKILAETELIDHSNIPEGFRTGYVTIVGSPNVGKSTLMNKMIGDRLSIVTPKVRRDGWKNGHGVSVASFFSVELCFARVVFH